MKNKLVILDGTSLVADAYYKGLTEEVANATTETEKEEAYKTLLKSTSGKYINAIQGFFKTFLRVMDSQNPTHVAVVWGTSRKTNYRRIRIYKNYKNDKIEMDAPLKEQIRTVKDMLTKLGVSQYSSEKYEALDLAGSMALKLKEEFDTYIVARNSNALQLADISNILLQTAKAEELAEEFNLDLSKSPKGFVCFDAQKVLDIKGLTPTQYIDYKALIGNVSTGIPGVKDIGEKTALPLVQEYGSIESIYDEILGIENDELMFLNEAFRNELGITTNPIPKLLKYKDEAFISKDLVKIILDVYKNKELDLEQLQWTCDKSLLVKELKKYDLTPVKRNAKKTLEKVPALVHLLKTYNTEILSPSSDLYVGDSISCINEDSLSASDEIMFVSEIWNQIANGTYVENKDVNDSSQSSVCDNTSTKEEVLIETTNISIKNTDIENVQEDNIDDNEEIFIEYSPDNNDSDEHAVYIAGTIKDSEDDIDEDIIEEEVVEDDSLVENNNITEIHECNDENDYENTQRKAQQEPVKEDNGFSLLESLLLKKYRCNSCNAEFIMVGQDVNYCPHCGVSYKKETNDNAVASKLEEKPSTKSRKDYPKCTKSKSDSEIAQLTLMI